MESSNKTYSNGAQRAFCKICKVSGKEGRGNNIKGHIERNHLQGVSIPCNICDEKFVSRNSLKQHKSKSHTREEILMEDIFKAEIIQI